MLKWGSLGKTRSLGVGDDGETPAHWLSFTDGNASRYILSERWRAGNQCEDSRGSNEWLKLSRLRWSGEAEPLRFGRGDGVHLGYTSSSLSTQAQLKSAAHDSPHHLMMCGRQLPPVHKC